jgi:site-specific DNA recombinase
MDQKIDALYCRVSTDIQREKGESIRNQKERLQEYAKANRLNPRFYIDEGISAKSFYLIVTKAVVK